MLPPDVIKINSGMPTDVVRVKPPSTPKEPVLRIANPLGAFGKGVATSIGAQFSFPYYHSRIPKPIGGMGLSHPEAMGHAEQAARTIEESKTVGIPAKVAEGFGQAVPILAGGPKPFMAVGNKGLSLLSKAPILGNLAKMPVAKTAVGFGGFEAARNVLSGHTDLAKSFLEGAGGGAAFHLGGRAGASIASKILGKVTKHASRIGSAAGAGAVSAAMAPEGEKIPSFVVGSSFGAKFPSKAFGVPENTHKYIIENYERGVGGKKKDTAFKIKRRDDSVVAMVKDITENAEEAPKNRIELFKAAEKRKGDIIRQINEIIEGSPSDVKIDTIRVGNKVAEFSRDKNIQTLAPELSAKAQVLARDIMARRGLSISEAHDMMMQLNEMARASYADPNPHRMKAVEMYRAAADALRADLNKTVDSLVDPRYSGLKRLWGSYEEISKDLAKAAEKEASKTSGMVSSGFDAYLLGDAISSVVTGRPEGAARSGIIKGLFELRKYLSSPEKNIQNMFKESKRAYFPKRYAMDEAMEGLAEKVKASLQNKQLRDYVMAEQAKSTPVEAELVEPPRLPAPKPFNPYQKLLPSRGQYGQSSGPVIEQGAAPELIPPEVKKLPFRSPEKGAKLFGEGFTSTVGSQRKGQISAKVAQILRTTPPEQLQRTIESLPEAEKQAAKDFMRSMWERISGKEGFARTSKEKDPFEVPPEKGGSEKKFPLLDKDGSPIKKSSYDLENGKVYNSYGSEMHARAIPKGRFDKTIRLILDHENKYFGTRFYATDQNVMKMESGELSKDLYKQMSLEAQAKAARAFVKDNPGWKWIPNIGEHLTMGENLMAKKVNVTGKSPSAWSQDIPKEQSKIQVKENEGDIIVGSPNVKESMTVKQAIDQLKTSFHKNKLKTANEIAKKVLGGEKYESFDGVGTWEGEKNVQAENSIAIIRKVSDAKSSYRIAAMEGIAFDQKTIMVITKNGNDTYYKFSVQEKDLAKVIKSLEEKGIRGSTPLTNKGKTDIIIANNDQFIGNTLLEIGDQYGGIEIGRYSGKVEFLGDSTSRAKARKVFSSHLTPEEIQIADSQQATRRRHNNRLNNEKGSARISEDRPQENSRLVNLIKNNQQNIWTPDQLRGFLVGKVAKEEMNTILTPELMSQPKISKADILKATETNMPKIETVVKGQDNIDLMDAAENEAREFLARRNKLSPEVEDLFDKWRKSNYDPEYGSELDAVLEKNGGKGLLDYAQEGADKNLRVQTKFSQYQLPGGENYREVVFKGPDVTSKWKILKNEDGEYDVVDQKGKVRFTGIDTKSAQEYLNEEKILANKREGVGFQSSHVDEPNGLGWNRYNDRTTPDGKKVLFMEETQDVSNEKGGKEFLASHPLGKNRSKFTEYRLKQALKDAVNSDAKYLSWTTGEQQASRYDLSKQIKSVEATKISKAYELKSGKDIDVNPDKYNIRFIDNNGKEHFTSVDSNKLSETVGKDLAQKIINQGNGTQKYQGLDLKVGGEWAKNLYDKQIPNILKDLTGQGVEYLDIGTSERTGQQLEPVGTMTRHILKKIRQPAIRITPELKAQIKSGKGKINELFSIAGATIASSLIPKQAQAAISDDDSLKAILGEAENQGLNGMRALASALKNRGKLGGVYGHKAIVEKNGKYYRRVGVGLRLIPDKIVNEARQAIKDSLKKDYSNGADHWENIKAFGKPGWAETMEEAARVGDHVFYRKKKK